MTAPILDDINVNLNQLPYLNTNLLRQVLNFLNRWENYQETLECVATIAPLEMVSLQDAYAKALVGLERYDEAVQVMQSRLEQKMSNPAQLNLAIYHLKNGDTDGALRLTEEIARRDIEYGRVHFAFGEIALLKGKLDTAKAAYLAFQRKYPNSCQGLLGLAKVYRKRGDTLTAGAYAVRAFRVGEGEREIPINLLRELRDIFAELGDQNRLADANLQLADRFSAEMEILREAVQGGVSALKRVKPTPRQERAVPRTPPPPLLSLPDLTNIPVSSTERVEIESAVQEMFYFPTMRPAQTEIITCVRRGENVLAILPTGAGKSLCYQLPAFMGLGLTLVISPLIALMKDQIDGLPARVRSKAIAINSSLEGPALRRAIEEISQGNYRLVYAAPERLRQLPFLYALRRVGLTQLVIDEAHCVSMWGHDFRPDYLRIAQTRRELGEPPILALTATAPWRVRQDIERQLFGDASSDDFSIQEEIRFIALDTYRSNLKLSAIQAKSEDEKRRLVIGLCHKFSGSGIVYARTRKKCEELAALLRQQGLNAAHYHAGISKRAEIQERFMNDEVDIIVATIAFGMGVDKADIRFIIHYGLPDSVEAYYQEAGRSGRDGEPSACVLLYTTSDKATLTRHANQSVVKLEFLRRVYGMVRDWLDAGVAGRISLDALWKALESDEITTRVSISILEQVGLLIRHHDVPDSVRLRPLPDQTDASFEQFIDVADLIPLYPNQRDYLELAVAAQISATELEEQLFAWQQVGLLDYQPFGRSCLYTLPPASANAANRLESLLDQNATIQKQRVLEIWDYARSARCRHGHLSNYLGGKPRTDCAACDNCVEEIDVYEEAQSAAEARFPSQSAQLEIILQALAESSWGHVTLNALLRGEPTQNPRAQLSSAFGKLSFLSKYGLQKMTSKLLRAEYIGEKTLSHGGIALEVTPVGRRALADESLLQNLVS